MSFDLQTERLERGLTIADLARELRVARKTVRMLETGATSTPSAPTVKAIADFFGVPVRDVLDALTTTTPEELAS